MCIRDRESSYLEKFYSQRVDAVIQIGGKVDELVSDTRYVQSINKVASSMPVPVSYTHLPCQSACGTGASRRKNAADRSWDGVRCSAEWRADVSGRKAVRLNGWLNPMPTESFVRVRVPSGRFIDIPCSA